MKKAYFVTVVLLFALIAFVGAAAASSSPRNFRAHLAGRNEVPAVDTLGQGQAIFQLSPDGTQLHFRLIAANIEDVRQAHIHCGGPDVNGPVVAFLYGLDPVVSPNGTLSQGTLTAANVIPRPDSAACPGGVADFADMLAKIEAGGAYVNVHTVDNPGGEIRGQIH